jgi:pyruvate formate lyase activating enzyme
LNCNFCERRCDLSGGKFGVCRMYRQENGAILERFPHRWSTYMLSRIESLPFYHVYPGSRSMTLGTLGCNFDCRYCANGFIAKAEPETRLDTLYEFTPEELVAMATKRGCHNIVFNVNEPTVSLPSLRELAEAASASGVPMGCLTNAYMTEESTELMAGIFSFMNISLKGLSADFCQQYLGIADAAPVLRNIRRLATTTHLEITTPVIQSVNDGDIDQIAEFIASVDPEIPWHVFRLLPEHKMKGADYPNVAAIDKALTKSRKLLPYVYFHNFVGSDWVNTNCPNCKTTVIERFSLGCGGDRLSRYHCQDNKCPACGRAINIHGRRTGWNSGEGTA